MAPVQHQMSVLDPGTVKLEGLHLIEASAGTGKTYTITGLYLRLLLEKRLRPEQILVVTFTEAATKELKEKIRQRLAEALAAFKGEALSRPDPFVEELALRYRDDASAVGVISAAIWSMDLAAIFTIHGFCGRLLQEFFVTTDFSATDELASDNSSLVQQLIDDYWRCNARRWDAALTGYLHFRGCSADSLFMQLHGAIQQLLPVGLSSLVPAGDAGFAADRRQLVEDLAALWSREQETITGLLKSGVLKVSHDSEKIDACSEAIGKYFAGDVQDFFPVAAFEMFSASVLAGATRKNRQVPAHPFFSRVETLLAALDREYEAIRRQVVEQCVIELPARKAAIGLRNFDDLLFEVRDGLRAKEAGVRFARDVREKYPVALIDEFQDTDTVQFEIFERIYRWQDSSLFLIGDPKQAIYRFRGADIFAYLKASTRIDNKHTLATNYRSVPSLVKAINRLFTLRSEPFLFSDIAFRPVAAAPEPPVVLHLPDDDNDRPLVIWRFDAQDNRIAAKWLVGKGVADEIWRLLIAGRQSGARLGERNLAGGDIAVLVRTHSDGEIIRTCLQERQVRSVTYSQASVFLCQEAWELQLLLAAVTQPWDEKRLKAALASSLFGYSAGTLEALQNGDRAWTAVVDRFVGYQQTWQDHGLVGMMRLLLLREGVSERLAGYDNGERRLTNLRHLLEIVQREVRLDGLGPVETVTWLKRRRRDVQAGDEEQLRLESDEHLVKIVTIHRSKGLEFPIVFCPFLWDSRLPKRQPGPVFFHDGDARLQIDLGGGSGGDGEELQELEDLAEELRLLYVALTRARNRCYLSWGRVTAGYKQVMAASGLGYLLQPVVAGSRGVVRALQEQYKGLEDEALFALLEPLAGKSDETVSVIPMPIPGRHVFIGIGDLGVPGPALVFNRRLPPSWAVRSFSALQHGVPMAEEPDHDGMLPAAEQESLNWRQAPTTKSFFTFPAGRQAGSCLHKIFEEIDFATVDRQALTRLIVEQLRRFGFDPAWSEPLTAAIGEVLITPLDREAVGLSLSRLNRERRLDELEFYYSLPTAKTAGLRRIFERHMVSAPAAASGFAAYPDNGPAELQNDFMKGFVDLVFEWQGKYYVVDYKSNHLGFTLADYSQDKLDRAMAEGGYDLQYHIYVLALHRYLRHRLRESYDYDRHFGAVYYLFIRGMRAAEGDGFGVCRRRPARQVIESLDRCLGGHPA